MPLHDPRFTSADDSVVYLFGSGPTFCLARDQKFGTIHCIIPIKAFLFLEVSRNTATSTVRIRSFNRAFLILFSHFACLIWFL